MTAAIAAGAGWGEVSQSVAVDVPQPSEVASFVAAEALPFDPEALLLLDRLGEQGALDDNAKSYLRSIAGFSRHMQIAYGASPITADGAISDEELALVLFLERFSDDLVRGVIGALPDSASAEALLADGKIDGVETTVLERADSVFSIPAFASAWSLELLKANEVAAVVRMLTFYDPFTTLHDIAADPDDPAQQGADLFRALDQFGVYPGDCVFCNGQRYMQTDDGVRRRFRDQPAPPSEEFIEYYDAVNREGVYVRNKLLSLVHHAAVQADGLSPCDLRDFDEAGLRALGTNNPMRIGTHAAFGMGFPLFMPSTILRTDQLREAFSAETSGNDDGRPARQRRAPIYVAVGDVLSPFTQSHAIVTRHRLEDQPAARNECEAAALAILTWHANRYVHYLERYQPFRILYGDTGLFTENPMTPPAWATILSFESGNKTTTVVAMMRSMNIPAIEWLGAEIPEGVGISELYTYFAPADEARWQTAGSTSARQTVQGDILFPGFNTNVHHNFGYPEDGWRAYGHMNRLPPECRFETTANPMVFDWASKASARQTFAPQLRYVCD